jgi:hypothetical protein
MDSSTSTPPDAGGAPVPGSGHTTLSTIAEQVAAIDRLILLARQSIKVFDQDLSQTGWNAPARSEHLTAFLKGSPHARLDIIVHDTRWIVACCPRLTALLRRWSHAIRIFRTGAEAQAATDPLVIVDARHYLRRFHIDHPRADLGIDVPADARPLVNRFDEIWATGEPGITATTLGL